MTEDPILKIWLLEYDKLKTEQTQRIGFRDNLLYVTLGILSVTIPIALTYQIGSSAKIKTADTP
jgi:hypothetical protein